MIPEEPQFSEKCGVLLGFFWGRLRGLLVLQTQPLDLLEDLPELVSQSVNLTALVIEMLRLFT